MTDINVLMRTADAINALVNIPALIIVNHQNMWKLTTAPHFIT